MLMYRFFNVLANSAKMGLVETKLAIIPGAGEILYIFIKPGAIICELNIR